MSGKRMELCDRDYLSSDSYAEFVFGRIKNGGLWSAVKRISKNVRKYTLLTAVIKTVALIVGLLEKSAILLLVFTGMVLMLPAFALVGAIFAVMSVIEYFRIGKTVRPWIEAAEKVTVYVTSDRFYPPKKGGEWSEKAKRTAERAEAELAEMSLFARCAVMEAEKYEHPVIVVCSDGFTAAKWAGFNLLTVKCDYFYVLRKYYFGKKEVTYVILS
ncbi:MAG: hypothetical protein IJY04_04250 [Clostridia bacterium]|nr:hypothetical protein [Clostridia bacterium]